VLADRLAASVLMETGVDPIDPARSAEPTSPRPEPHTPTPSDRRARIVIRRTLG
jgi:hypothetical protein